MTYRSNRSGGVRLTRGIGMVVERFDSSPDNEIMFNPKMIFSGESINIVEKGRREVEKSSFLIILFRF